MKIDNFSYDLRNRAPNSLIFGLVPGPEQPKNLRTFLPPFFGFIFGV